MSVLRPQVEGVPVPVPSLDAGPYWEGCRRGELLFQRCTVCGAVPPAPSPICHRCHRRTLSWERSAGTGTLYSWTVVWRPQHPAFEVPYAPAIIDVVEGFRVLSAMVGCDPDDLVEAMPVRVEFHHVSEEIALPFFSPAPPPPVPPPPVPPPPVPPPPVPPAPPRARTGGPGPGTGG